MKGCRKSVLQRSEELQPILLVRLLDRLVEQGGSAVTIPEAPTPTGCSDRRPAATG
jgi:hypothetical protein